MGSPYLIEVSGLAIPKNEVAFRQPYFLGCFHISIDPVLVSKVLRLTFSFRFHL